MSESNKVSGKPGLTQAAGSFMAASWMRGAVAPHMLVPKLVNARRIVRDLQGLPETICRSGSLELKFAVTKKEIRRAQKLRWRVFYKEGSAIPDRLSQIRRRDICAFDRVCDHLIVVDHSAVNRFGRNKPRVVGTYRLLRQDAIRGGVNFYSASEFDIGPLIARHPGKRFLELGRSCVLPEYRSKRTIELLWRGIWLYVNHHKIDVMIGCASFDGVDPSRHALALSFLHHCAPAQDDWRACAAAGRSIDMNMMPQASIQQRRAIALLPTLIKGYLRLGATFGAGAVVDRQFGTTDVFVVLPVANIDRRYVEYYSAA